MTFPDARAIMAAVALVMCPGWTGSLPGQESVPVRAPELVTDRPDFTESPVAVPTGAVQLEGGGTWERSEGRHAFSGPEFLARVGFARGWELRLGVPDYVDTAGRAGFGDASIGLKTELGSTGPWEWGAILTASLPTAEEGLGSDGVDPELLLTTGRGVGPDWSLGTQASVLRRTDVGMTEVGATIVAGRALGETVGSFLEVAATGATGDVTSVILHHGYTVSTGALTQLDLHVGAGLTRTAPDVLVGVGWSGRF